MKAEISLCRVYKRAGVEDHPSLPRCLPITKQPSSSRSSKPSEIAQHQHLPHNMGLFLGQSNSKPVHDGQIVENHETEGISSTGSGSGSGSEHHVTTALGLSKYNAYRAAVGSLSNTNTIGLPAEEEGLMLLPQHHQSNNPKQPPNNSLVHACFPANAVPSNNNNNNVVMMDDLNRLVSYQPQFFNVQSHPNHQLSALLMQTAPPMSLNSLPNTLPTTFSDRLWDWNPIPEVNQDHPNIMPFK